jgi:hypothetical protein
MSYLKKAAFCFTLSCLIGVVVSRVQSVLTHKNDFRLRELVQRDLLLIYQGWKSSNESPNAAPISIDTMHVDLNLNNDAYHLFSQEEAAKSGVVAKYVGNESGAAGMIVTSSGFVTRLEPFK